jgi:hypothetical protein
MLTAILAADVKDYHSCGKVQFMSVKCDVWLILIDNKISNRS